MNCTTCTAHLNDYLDAELRPEVAQEVAAHLAGCPGCRQEFDTLRAVLSQARALPLEVPPPHDLWPSLAAELENVSAPASASNSSNQGETGDAPKLRSAGRSLSLIRFPVARWL